MEENQKMACCILWHVIYHFDSFLSCEYRILHSKSKNLFKNGWISFLRFWTAVRFLSLISFSTFFFGTLTWKNRNNKLPNRNASQISNRIVITIYQSKIFFWLHHKIVPIYSIGNGCWIFEYFAGKVNPPSLLHCIT